MSLTIRSGLTSLALAAACAGSSGSSKTNERVSKDSWCDEVRNKLGLISADVECLSTPGFYQLGLLGPKTARDEHTLEYYLTKTPPSGLEPSSENIAVPKVKYVAQSHLDASGGLDPAGLPDAVKKWVPNLNLGGNKNTSVTISVEISEPRIVRMQNFDTSLKRAIVNAMPDTTECQQLQTLREKLCQPDWVVSNRVVIGIPKLTINTDDNSSLTGALGIKNLLGFHVDTTSVEKGEISLTPTSPVAISVRWVDGRTLAEDVEHLCSSPPVCKSTLAGALVLGGQVAGGRWDNGAENWDPRRRVWQQIKPVPDTNLCRAGVVRLGDGRILVAGGGGSNGCSDDGATTNRTRWFDPPTNMWQAPDCGRPCMELSAGGRFALDESSKRWVPFPCAPRAACMMYGRNSFPSVALSDGRAFVFGGCAGGCNGPNAISQTVIMRSTDGGEIGELARTAEIFDPHTNTWAATPPSLKRRTGAAAVEVSSGRVLVCGGNDGFQTTYDDCELYDLNNSFNRHRAWSKAGKLPTRGTPQLVATGQDGPVLGISGGEWWMWTSIGDYWQAREDDVLGAWRAGGRLPTPVDAGVATSLNDGRVLLIGGVVAGQPSNTVHVDRSLLSLRGGASLSVARIYRRVSRGRGVRLAPTGDGRASSPPWRGGICRRCCCRRGFRPGTSAASPWAPRARSARPAPGGRAGPGRRG